MEVWHFIQEKLNHEVNVQLLYVLESEESSPGRKGFKMAVAGDGDFCGTIGGGIMEHKLAEKAKAMLQQNSGSVLVMRQYHDKEHTRDQSGMICNGSQLMAFIPLSVKDRQTIETIVSAPQPVIELSPGGLQIATGMAKEFEYNADDNWLYYEQVKLQPVIHIIGGGHVSLALSELMCYLGFFSKVYDDRPELNTILQNFFANEKIIIPAYDQLGEYISDNKNHFVVIMTKGYRTDKLALQQLLGKDFYYLGMMGSDRKVEMLKAEMLAEGADPALLKKVFMPIGLNIYSKTAQEIAVSIAAEIIREKNKELPTGRQKDA